MSGHGAPSRLTFTCRKAVLLAVRDGRHGADLVPKKFSTRVETKRNTYMEVLEMMLTIIYFLSPQDGGQR